MRLYLRLNVKDKASLQYSNGFAHFLERGSGCGLFSKRMLCSIWQFNRLANF